MHLVQELVDYIIDFLHDDLKTLIQLSLVSRAWVGRARVYIWETVKITPLKLVSNQNPSYLTPLCGYIKVLRLVWPVEMDDLPRLPGCFEQSTPHTLVFQSSRLHFRLDEQTIRRSFTKFPCASITTLKFHDIDPNHRAFLVLLSFPNVDNLSVSVKRYREQVPSPDQLGNSEKEIIQRTSTDRFRGSFKLSDSPDPEVWGGQRSKILRTIAAFPLQFQTVSLDTSEDPLVDVLIFLNLCSKTVRKVFVRLTYQDTWTGWPPADFPNLEELRVRLSLGVIGAEQHLLLGSITSPNLQRMIIEIEDEALRCSIPDLDEGLTNLVRRYNSHRHLAFQISTRQHPERIRRLLPRVAQQGVWEVCHSVRPEYCA